MRTPAPNISLLAVSFLLAACQGGSGDDDGDDDDDDDDIVGRGDAGLIDSGGDTDGPVGSDAPVSEVDASIDPPADAAAAADAGGLALPASFIPCSAGQALRVFVPDDLPLSIPDDNNLGITSHVTATGAGEIARAAVIIWDLPHTFVADLLISLVSPSSGTFDLSSINGVDGDNYVDTVLDTTCATSVINGVAPFSSCFRPEASLAPLVGVSTTGSFRLNVVDNAGSDVGSLNGWALALCVQP